MSSCLRPPCRRPRTHPWDSDGLGPRLRNLLCTQGASETTALLGAAQPPDFQMESGLLDTAERRARADFVRPPPLWNFLSSSTLQVGTPCARCQTLFSVLMCVEGFNLHSTCGETEAQRGALTYLHVCGWDWK